MAAAPEEPARLPAVPGITSAAMRARPMTMPTPVACSARNARRIRTELRSVRAVPARFDATPTTTIAVASASATMIKQPAGLPNAPTPASSLPTAR
jgi:hypothetical protein